MYYSKCILCFISIIFFLVSCKETCDTTPFNFHCLIRVVGGDDSSSFKKKPDQIYEIVTNLLEPRNAKIVNFVYLENYDCIDIQVQEYIFNIKNGIVNYVLEIQYPNGIRMPKDTIRVEYKFEMNQSYIISAFCNDKEPKYMAEDVIVFEMKNK